MKKKQSICPITYSPIESNQKYSAKGLRWLSPALKNLVDLPYSAEQQRKEAQKRADKISIQGVQPKLSARLNTKMQSFEICDEGGTYILKPQNNLYSELPENENLSMRLATSVMGVPLHGLLYCLDGSFTYFIKRFDRVAYGNKVPIEDFAQLAGLARDTKYDYSMEKLIPIIDRFCTFPAMEKSKLLTRVVFNYLIGNEDMHLKNYSLITRNEFTEIAPAYDFINTTIAMGGAKEQIALPLNGKKNNLTRRDIIDYYGMQRLGLNSVIIDEILNRFRISIPQWHHLIEISFLSKQAKKEYRLLVDERIKIFAL